MNDRVRLHPSWRERLEPELSSPAMAALRAFLVNEKAAGKAIYPPGPLIFNALDRTPFDAVKVVILGQDPYHGPGQAHGLSFSVPRGVAVPPSLVNIHAEIQRDLGITPPRHGNLEAWAERGVLLLNSVLTVEAGQAASHQGRGWETFTDRIVSLLAAEREHLVFLLWGSHAQRKAAMVDPQRHLLLKAPHPSPLSAHRGFLGCGHFSACNAYLTQHGIAPIDWSLPPA